MRFFRLQEPITVDGNDVYSVRGGSESLRKLVEVLCDVGAVFHNAGAVSHKQIGRRSPEEEQFLEDLFEWIQESGVRPKKRLF